MYLLGMAQSIDNGVQATGCLGTEGRNLREQRGDGALAADDGEENDKSVWGPDASPQGNVGNGNLGNSHFSRFSILLSIAPQAVHVHLLGLFAESVFVSPHSLDDGAVVEEDHDQGEQVAEEESKEHIALVVPVILKIIIGASVEQSFSGVSTPDVK